MLVLWNVIPYSMVDRYQHFRKMYCFHHQRRKWSWFIQNIFTYVRNYNCVTSRNTITLMLTAVIISALYICLYGVLYLTCSSC